MSHQLNLYWNYQLFLDFAAQCRLFHLINEGTRDLR